MNKHEKACAQGRNATTKKHKPDNQIQLNINKNRETVTKKK